MVGAADGVFVMLHHHQRVALGFQLGERVEQHPVVARVQADGRLVEDVAHPRQARAQLRRQADALCLATRERRGGTVQRQIAQPHLLQKAQTATQLGHDVAGDVRLPAGERHAFHEVRHRIHRAGGERMDRPVGKAHRARHRVQPRALAARAGFGRLFVHGRQIQVVHFLFLHLADHQPGTETRPAPAMLAVEGEQARVQLGETLAATGTGPVGGEHFRLRTHSAQTQHLEHALAHLQRRFHLLAQQALVPGADLDHAHRQFDGVLHIAIQTRPLAGGQVIAIHPQLFIALASRPLGQIGVQALAVVDERREQLHRVAPVCFADARDDGLETLRRHRHIAGGAVLGAQLHVDQAQEVVQLGERGHRALAPAPAGALLDGHRGRDAEDGIHLGPRRRLHELTGIGVERFQIAPLPLAEEDVEGQRGLARSGHPGDHRKALARDVHIDVLEVVLAGVPDAHRAGRARPVGHRLFRHLEGGGGFRQLRLVFGQRPPGVRCRVLRHLGRRAFGDQQATALAAFRPQVHQPVGGADHVQVVFDHQQRVPGIHQFLEGLEQARRVVEVQAGGGLVK